MEHKWHGRTRAGCAAVLALSTVTVGASPGPAQQTSRPPIMLRRDALVVSVLASASVDITADRIMLVYTVGCPNRAASCDIPTTLHAASVDLIDAGIDRESITTVDDTTPGHPQGRVLVTLLHPQSATVERTRRTILSAAFSARRFGDVVRDAQTYAALDDCPAALAEIQRKVRANTRGSARQLATLVGSSLGTTPTELVVEPAAIPYGVLCGAAVTPGAHDQQVAVEPADAAIVRLATTIEQTYTGSKPSPVTLPVTGLERFMTSETETPPLGLVYARYAVPTGAGVVFTVGSATRALSFASGMHPYTLALRIAAMRAREAAADAGSSAGAPEVIAVYPSEKGDAILAAGFAFAPVPFANPQWTAPPGRVSLLSISGGADRMRMRQLPVHFGGEGDAVGGVVTLPADAQQLAITLHPAGFVLPPARTVLDALSATLRPLGAECCASVTSDATSLRAYAVVTAPALERSRRIVDAIHGLARGLQADVNIASRLRLADCLAADRAARRFALANMQGYQRAQPVTITSLVQSDTAITNGTCGARFDARAFEDENPSWPDASVAPFDPAAPLEMTVADRITVALATASPATGHGSGH